jgi:small subunit ribosomal protein S6
MREYELTVVYDLAVAEAGGADAGVTQITTLLEARGGKILKLDHWGRRRLAYPIKGAIDGDYIVSRVELDPTAVAAIEGTLRINEKVYRHLVVRADELPLPPPPREPRQPVAAPAEALAAEATAPVAVAEQPAEASAPVAVAEQPAEASAPVAVAEQPAEASAPVAVAEEPAEAAAEQPAETPAEQPAEAAAE